MKVDTMRAIDRYLGIPLCFFSTIITKIFFRPKKNVRPKNILFIELSEMGSAILVDPAMRKVKERYNGELFFLIFEKNKPSLELLQTVPEENIFVIRPEGFHLIADTLRFFSWARKKKIDTVIDIELFSRYTALLTGYSGADNRVGFYRFHNEGLYRGEMLTHKISYNPYLHISKNFMAMIEALEEDISTLPHTKTLIQDEDIVLQKVEISEEAKNKMYEVVDTVAPKGWRKKYPRILLVNPNASDLLPHRRWPVEHFIEFIKIILFKHQDILVLITGSPSEKPLAEGICKEVDNERCVSFNGKATLKEMLSLYAISAAMLTNDSGPGHFSSVTDMPTTVIFGPETPALYGSLGNFTPIYLGLSCSPCVSATNHRKTACKDNQCVKRITPKSVVEILSNILDNK